MACESTPRFAAGGGRAKPSCHGLSQQQHAMGPLAGLPSMPLGSQSSPKINRGVPAPCTPLSPHHAHCTTNFAGRSHSCHGEADHQLRPANRPAGPFFFSVASRRQTPCLKILGHDIPAYIHAIPSFASAARRLLPRGYRRAHSHGPRLGSLWQCLLDNAGP